MFRLIPMAFILFFGACNPTDDGGEPTPEASPGIEDQDGDGYAIGTGDCDDLDPNSYVGAPEVCDAADNDCDGLVDESIVVRDYCEDKDSDGWGDLYLCILACNVAVLEGRCSTESGTCEWTDLRGDCNDLNSWVNPSQEEVCDSIDNDCDTIVDEGFDQDLDQWTSCGGDCNDNDYFTRPYGTEMCDDGKDNDCDGDVDDGCPLKGGDAYYSPDR